MHGVGAIGERALLHPAAHDEPALRVGLLRQTFSAARGFAFYTEAERALAFKRFPIAHKPSSVVGMGVEATSGDEAKARAAIGLGERPFVLYVGRLENGKGCRMLDEFFRRYKQRNPSELALVFIGPALEQLEPHPDIVVAGVVDDEVKDGALAGAELLINPSAMESFSIVLLEAWLAGTPVLVNAWCGPTVEHAACSEGGLWFDGYASFEACLDRLLSDGPLREELARRGAEYTRTRYAWPAVLDRYEELCGWLLTLPRRRNS